MKQALRAAQDRPLAAQVEAEAVEEERVKEHQQLDAAFARMARFREEMARTAGPVATPPAVSDSTQPGKIPDLVAELERLRARVADMEKEREEARKKRSSLSVLSPHLVGGPHLSLREWGALHDQHVGQHKGAIMETLTSRGSTLALNSHRNSPLA